LYLRILGVAAGGGYPQWNCACVSCQQARAERRPRRQYHASLAVSVTGENWYIVNATPDVRFQIESYEPLHPGPNIRQTKLRGILLTDAEFDHSIGLLVLREGSALQILGTSAVIDTLTSIFPIGRLLESYAAFDWVRITIGEEFQLDEGKLRVKPFRLGVKRPRYAIGQNVDGDWVIGYRFEDANTGGVAIYAPGIETWTDELTSRLGEADLVFVDGTFWSEDEMVSLGISRLKSHDMGHIPIWGEDGTAMRLSQIPASKKIYVHVNNTNPVLNENSPEHRQLIAKGIEVAWDGMDLEV
jgi:pyrroloquinoline quinone biosynthesis protein B